MNSLDTRLIRLIDKIYHSHGVILLNQVNVGRRTGPDLHLEAKSLELDSLDHLVQFEIANEKIIAFANVANVAG